MSNESISEEIARLDGAPVSLAPDDIHCWLFSLESDADHEHLDDAERDRARRFHFDRDRRRFIAGHDSIRRILSRYLDVAPGDFEFDVEAQGRPTLKGGGVNFNYSRSEEWGLLAVSDAAILGADIETVRMSDDLIDVARRQFSPAEQAALNPLSGDAWTAGFYNCWTRKEAVVKAMGVGLLAPLDCFDVTLTPGDRPEILRAEGDGAVARDWALRAFSPLDGYCAAIATDLAAPNLHVLRVKPQTGSRY